MTHEPWKAELERARELFERLGLEDDVDAVDYPEGRLIAFAHALAKVRAEERENIAKWHEAEYARLEVYATEYSDIEAHLLADGHKWNAAAIRRGKA